MFNFEYLWKGIPRSLHSSIVLVTIILINILVIDFCSYMECYQLSTSNILHLNIICNGCINITYELQKHHLKIYLIFGKVIMNIVENYIQDVKQNVKVD